MKKTVLIVMCLIAGISVSTAQVKLSFNPAKGTKYFYQYETTQDIKQTIMGQEMPMKQKMVVTYDMNTVEKSKEGTTMEFIYRYIYYDMTSPMANIKYDSSNPSASPSPIDAIMAKIFNVLLGKRFELVVAADGSVISASEMDEVLQEMMKALEEDGAMGQQVGVSVSQQFSNDAIKKNFEQSTKIYPGQSIKVGDTWDIVQRNEASGMSFDVATTYQLMSADKKTAFVNAKSDIEGMDGKLTGEQTGKIEIGLKSGVKTASELTQTIKGVLFANGMDIPVDIVSLIKITTTETK